MTFIPFTTISLGNMNCRIGGSNPVSDAKIDPGPWKGFIFVRELMLIVESLILTRVFQDSRFSLKKKAEPTKHKPGGHIERIQKDF